MPYPSSLSDVQWIVICELFTALGVKTRKHSLRTILDACLYIVNNGTKWRELPHDFPPWQTVYYHFSKWSQTHIWEAVSFQMSELAREASSRDPSPSLLSIDSQSLTFLFELLVFFFQLEIFSRLMGWIFILYGFSCPRFESHWVKLTNGRYAMFLYQTASNRIFENGMFWTDTKVLNNSATNA